MSVPPNTPPPGGYYYTPPPQNRGGGSGGCLKAAGITCGVLLLLGVVLVLFSVMAVKKQLQNPDIHNPVGAGIAAGISATNGMKIQQAIVRYHQQTGKYPANLNALYPNYLTDGKILHSPLDSNPNPGHISWTYIKPAEGADPKSPLLRLPYEINMTIGGSTSSQKQEIVINLDGTETTNTSTSGSYNRTFGQPGSSDGSGGTQ
jgi:hypothetical protein